MTPSARIQAAIEILGALESTTQPADKYLREWFRARRYAGSKDRAAVAERVYDVLRHKGSFAWRLGNDQPRALVSASLLAEGKSAEEIAPLFNGEGYGPPPLSEDEQRALSAAPREDAPPHVQGDYHEWLEPELKRGLGDNVVEEMRAMFVRAPVDLRVNTLRASRPEILTGLRALNVMCEPTPYSPWGIRVPSTEGLGQLQQTQFFLNGAFEFQDEASQIAALLCGAKPGQTVLDLAAGAGGKSLALAAAMEDKGSILAFDDSPERLKPLSGRIQRAGATIIGMAPKRGGPKWGDGKFDLVLVDSPCSGSGTWRRNPELKWRLTQERLMALTAVQGRLIDDGARHTKPGGRLVYATCSLLPSENEDVIAAFLARSPSFRPLSALEIWRETGQEAPPGMAEFFRASPLKTATDGFFVCIMQRDR